MAMTNPMHQQFELIRIDLRPIIGGMDVLEYLEVWFHVDLS